MVHTRNPKATAKITKQLELVNQQRRSCGITKVSLFFLISFLFLIYFLISFLFPKAEKEGKGNKVQMGPTGNNGIVDINPTTSRNHTKYERLKDSKQKAEIVRLH